MLITQRKFFKRKKASAEKGGLAILSKTYVYSTNLGFVGSVAGSTTPFLTWERLTL